MPAVHGRSVATALKVAIGMLLIAMAIGIVDLISIGSVRLWVLLVTLAMALGAAVMALRHQRLVEVKLEALRQTDDALRASEAKFSGILAIAADAIITIDDAQCIIHFNHGAEGIFGYQEREAVGQPLTMLLPERFRPTHGDHVRAFGRSDDAARRMGHRREVSGRRKDGTEFPAEAAISKLDLPGAARIYTVVLRDTTERKRAEQAERFLADTATELARSLESGAVLNAIGAAALPTLADACFLDIVDENRSIRRLAWAADVGHRDVMMQLGDASPLTWDSPSPVIDVLRRDREELVEGADDEWIASIEEHPQAQLLWRGLGVRSVLMVPLSIADRTLGVLSLLDLGTQPVRFTPDTRRVAREFARGAALALENARLYSAAKRATVARDEVLAIVSHDLRNPISAVAMCARILRESPPSDPAERERMLVAITEATAWMQRLIRDLLDVAAIENGKLSIDRRLVSLSSIIAAATAMTGGEIEARSIDLVVDVPADLPLVRADNTRIVQVLTNLLGNAMKFTSPGGSVMIRAVRDAQGVVVCVRDTGMGIMPGDLPRIFDRFWQASATPRSGSGLGLAIARGIVEAHAGRIWVESEVGRGSTFCFQLPVDGAARSP